MLAIGLLPLLAQRIADVCEMNAPDGSVNRNSSVVDRPLEPDRSPTSRTVVNPRCSVRVACSPATRCGCRYRRSSSPPWRRRQHRVQCASIQPRHQHSSTAVDLHSMLAVARVDGPSGDRLDRGAAAGRSSRLTTPVTGRRSPDVPEQRGALFARRHRLVLDRSAFHPKLSSGRRTRSTLGPELSGSQHVRVAFRSNKPSASRYVCSGDCVSCSCWGRICLMAGTNRIQLGSAVVTRVVEWQFDWNPRPLPGWQDNADLRRTEPIRAAGRRSNRNACPSLPRACAHARRPPPRARRGARAPP